MARIWKEEKQSIGGHVTQWIYHVHVCAFTFDFDSKEEVEEYLDYYEKKIQPSGRAYQVGIAGHGDHADCQNQVSKIAALFE